MVGGGAGTGAGFELRKTPKFCGINLLIFPVGSRSEFVSSGNRYPLVIAFQAVGDLLSLLLYLMFLTYQWGFIRN